MKRLFTQFSFPGGIPSHVAPETPGSIHEGGELGYSLLHAYGAAFDNPDLLVCCVVGDGEAETGALAASWHSNKFLNPATDGAVLPILHLNGYKIANPTVLARIGDEELEQLLSGYGYKPYVVAGDDPETMHRLMAGTLDKVLDEIRADPDAGARRGLQPPAALADDRPEVARRAGPARKWSTAGRSRARSGRIRCRSPRSGAIPSISGCSRTGCAATGPRSCSTRAAGWRPSSRRSRPKATGAWAPTRAPMAACSCAT